MTFGIDTLWYQDNIDRPAFNDYILNQEEEKEEEEVTAIDDDY